MTGKTDRTLILGHQHRRWEAGDDGTSRAAGGSVRTTALTERRLPPAMSDITQLHRALIARVLDGDGKASTELRRAAFDNAGLGEPMRTLIEKVAHHAYSVTDEDVAAVRAAGLSEDQIFEIVVCAAIGEGGRQYGNAFAALASATEEGER
jgi:hypothetical protein